MNGPTGWFTWDEFAALCGPLDSDYVLCGDGIIINGDWRTLELDQNREIRSYPDGTQALYVNNRFVSLVAEVTVSVVDGSENFSVNTGAESAGFGYNSGNSLTATFRLIPGN